MPIHTIYKPLDWYNLAKRLVIACYEITQDLPTEEKSNLVHFIRNAGLTVYFNMSRGVFLKKKKKKKKFIEAAINALIVIDAAVEVLVELHLADTVRASELTNLSSSCYQALDALKKDK
jgi:four helix bundle protein